MEFKSDGNFGWLLGSVRMLGTYIYMKVTFDGIAQLVLRQHTIYSHFDDPGRMLTQHLMWSSETLTTWITGVTDIFLLGPFLSSETHLLCVDHDDVVSTIYVGSEVGFMLAAKHESDAGGNATKNLVLSINYHPILVNGFVIGRHRLVSQSIHLVQFIIGVAKLGNTLLNGNPLDIKVPTNVVLARNKVLIH